MNAFIIVDLQNDFLPGGALAVPDGDRIIPLVNKLQTSFELVVATQDWHPKNHMSFASNHKGKAVFDEIVLNGLDQILWPDHCVQGSKGAEFSPALDTNHIEAVFRKGMNREIDSYSGFYDNGHRKTTGLADYLRGRRVKKVFIAGLAADFCVYFTALDAVKEGFDTVLIEDATKPIEVERFNRLKNDFIKSGGKIIKSIVLK